MRFQAILFDLDGTLIDTINLYQKACIEGMRSIGRELSPEEFERLYVSGASLEEWVCQQGGERTQTPLVRKERDRVYHELLRTRPVFLDGAEELLRSLAQDPKAIVTGSWRSYVSAIDECMDVSKHFKHIITCDDTNPYHKPHPHGLLLAADRLNIEPEDCLYIGDQLFDIDAACAAGMTSCLIRSQFTPKKALGKADMEIQSLRTLIGTL